MSASREVVSGSTDTRFAFGENWQDFVGLVDERRIADAELSLKRMLGRESLVGQRFLDIGSGSGLFSLAARRLGAHVHSFDNDPRSVAATAALKAGYRAHDDAWTIEHGSVLDAAFMRALGKFDIVYAWGVLHHTGAMWQALENTIAAVAPGGRIWLALYNDQGKASVRWRAVKQTYNGAPSAVRPGIVVAVGLYFEVRHIAALLLHLRNPFRRRRARGMSKWHDLIDWVGGYPFEVSRPEEVLAFGRRHGLRLEALKTCGEGLGNNEYLFADDKPAPG